jgi:hypothetical protein
MSGDGNEEDERGMMIHDDTIIYDVTHDLMS